MATNATKSVLLVPNLSDYADKRTKYAATSLRGGDQFHLKFPMLGLPKGKLPIYGYSVYYDANGQPYQVLAYVRGGENAISYLNREFKKRHTGAKKEEWFGGFTMYLTQVCLTENCDLLRIERLSDELYTLLYPETGEAPVVREENTTEVQESYRQAA